MTLVEDSNGQSLATPRGRPIIFTPERLDQIRNLVERGHTREQIAEIVGCTLGSLTVTCSRAGISLRRPRELDPVVRSVKRPPPPVTPVAPAEPGPSREPNNILVPPGGWPPAKGKPLTFTLRINYGTRVYDVPLAIDDSTLGELACAADINGMRLSEMIVRALVAGVREVTS